MLRHFLGLSRSKFYFSLTVKSWNGESSNLNRSIAEDNKKSTVFYYDEDDYNNEFDQGKVGYICLRW